MNLDEFRNSTWYRDANRPGAEGDVAKQLPAWLELVTNSDLVDKAKKLWRYITSGKVSGGDKVLAIAALIYLISPIDLIPDAIPIFGWLDDLGVAAWVFQFLLLRINGHPAEQASVNLPALVDEEALSVDHWREFGSNFQSSPLPHRLAELQEAAISLGSQSLSLTARHLEFELKSPVTQILFAGRYNTGKSTLLNALLGHPWLPTGPVPTTRAITYVIGGPDKSLVSQDDSNVATLHHSPSSLTDGTDPSLANARSIALTVPSPFLHDGMTVVDSPGLEDPDLQISRLTLDAAPAATVVVLVLDATVLFSAADRTFVESLLAADRERKLVVVVNKADRIPPGEIASLRGELVSQLKTLGASAPVFFLSAREAAEVLCAATPGEPPQEFAEFRRELGSFLQSKLADERARHLSSRLAALEQGIVTLCQTNLAREQMSEEARITAAAKAEATRSVAEIKVEETVARLNERIGQLERRAVANFRVYFADLETALTKRINELGLRELKDTDQLTRLVRHQTQQFAESQLREVHTAMGDEVHGALFDLQSGLQGLAFTLPAPSGKPPINPEMVPPALLILSFPVLGFCHWVYLAAGLTFGRKAIEDLTRGLLESVGVNRVRSALLEQLMPKLKEFENGVFTEVANHFDTLRDVARQRAESLAAAALSPTEAFSRQAENPAVAAASRRWLEHFSPSSHV